MAPIAITVAAPPKLIVVAVVFNKLNVVWLVLSVSLLIARSVVNVDTVSLSLNFSTTLPLIIVLKTISKSSCVPVTSCATISILPPISKLSFEVSSSNLIPVPAPATTVPPSLLFTSVIG